MRRHLFLLLALVFASADAAVAQSCDAQITVPSGFCATIFADSVRGARHIAFDASGTLYVAARNSRGQKDGGVVVLRDSDGDGRADYRTRFGDNGGSGIFIRNNTLWYATDDAVLRYTLGAREGPDTIVKGLPVGGHAAKTITIGRDNDLYVNIGSLSNACQLQNRQAGSKGHDPCTELDTRAGIWRFNAMEKNQTQTKDKRFATGLRNVVAIHYAVDGKLYAAQHGRDNLSSNWGYSDQDNAEKPAEILVRVSSGDDYGWPYCYYDQDLKSHVLAPEYGGDGKKVTDRCDDVDEPLVAFPGHWAPNALVMYDGRQFPERYRRGFFIAFHGSWNRAPLPQAGYNVVFVPMNGDKPGPYEVFADGFTPITNRLPGGAEHRPTGVAVGPDGALYVSDDVGGRMYRIFYRGN